MKISKIPVSQSRQDLSAGHENNWDGENRADGVKALQLIGCIE
jgi:hypothetical protein